MKNFTPSSEENIIVDTVGKYSVISTFLAT